MPLADTEVHDPQNLLGNDHKSPQDDGFPCLICSAYSTQFTMAGIVRQPIDIPSLERYISKNVPEIKIPIDVKQVFTTPLPGAVTQY
jgi:hypothetical protein